MSSSNGNVKLPRPSLLSAPSAPHGGLFGLTAPIARQVYKPRLPINPKTLGAILLPLGYVHLFHALDAWGKCLADTWSGGEVTARDSFPLVNPSLWTGVEKTERQPNSFGVLLGGELIRGPYRVPTTEGFRYFKDQAEAESVWLSEEPKLRALFEQEQFERKRFVGARDTFRQFLHSGHETAFVLNPRTGMDAQVSSAFWISDAAAKVFELRSASDPLDRPLPQVHSVPALRAGQFFPNFSGYLILQTESLKRIAQLTAEPGPPVPATERASLDEPSSERMTAVPNDLTEWAAAQIGAAKSKGERLSQTDFEDRAAAFGLKRDSARDLWKDLAPPEWKGIGRPRKTRRKMREK